MLKKIKKLGLALLLPATAMVIATPLVLTSCGSDKSLATNLEQNFEEQKEITTTMSNEKVVSKLETQAYGKFYLLQNYFFTELIKEFVDYPIPELVGSGADQKIEYPISKEFIKQLERNDGLLNSAIKVENLKNKISKIEIKKRENKSIGFQIDETKYTLTTSISVTFNETQSKTKEYTLKIKPTIPSFDVIQDTKVGLDILHKHFSDSTNTVDQTHKEGIDTLYKEFSTNIEGKESVLEQAITYGLQQKGGLVSYDAIIEPIDSTGQDLITLNDVPFIPFEIKGKYTYYVEYIPVKGTSESVFQYKVGSEQKEQLSSKDTLKTNFKYSKFINNN